MKINLSLSLKLTLIVFSVSAIVIASMTYINIQEQSSFFENSYSEKATALAQSLDASIGSRSDLEDKQRLQNYILNFILLNKEDVLKVSINLPDENGDLKVAVSSDSDSVGNPSSANNYYSYEDDIVVNTPHHTGDSHTLTVVTPLHLSGQIVGTYEILLSMDVAYATLDLRTRNLVIISVAFLFFLVISFLYLLRRTVVKPITAFRTAANKIGEGDLDTKIKIKSRDELGELAAAFNHMTDDLKISRAEIENYSKTLEKKVEERTEELEGSQKELKRKVEALEKNKLAMINIMG
ncbi:MAG: HAMP domain-containing protein, partial [Candidatus Cloacimonetes bacterium]|nr:HAMP domain-containing protein [Candidatus Cloacimonadota bacterium]